jgi:hypothetical protein
VCVDWNGRNGCGDDDHYVELFNNSTLSLQGYRVIIGTCNYTIRDSITPDKPLVLFADMMNCSSFPQSGTAFLFDQSYRLVDARSYTGVIVFGYSWQPDTVNSSDLWISEFPNPGR